MVGLKCIHVSKKSPLYVGPHVSVTNDDVPVVTVVH